MKTWIASLLAAWLGTAGAQQSEPRGAPLDAVEARAEAAAALEAGRPAEAAELLAALARRDPTDAESRRLLGHARLAQGRADEARAAFVEALGLGRVTPAMLATLARIDLEAGRRDAAGAALSRLGWLEPADRGSTLLRAQNLATLGRVVEARALVDELTARAPQDPLAWRLSGSFALDRGDEDEAARALERAWWLGSREVELAEVLAGVALRRGRAERARRWLARLEDGSGRDAVPGAVGPAGDERRADLWRALARLELERGRPEAAVALLRERTGSARNAADAELLGHALTAAGRADEALEAWRRAARAGCDDRGILAHLLSVGLEHGDRALVEEALPRLERVADPAHADDARLRVLAHLRLDRPAAARAVVCARVAHTGLDATARELLVLLADRGPADG